MPYRRCSGAEASDDGAKGNAHERVSSARRIPKATSTTRIQVVAAFDILREEDPEKHLQHFVAVVVLHGWNEVTRCRAFPLSLAGQAQQWFTELPVEHIQSFEQLKKEFLEAFFAYILKKKSVMYLMNLQQKLNESLKQYVE